MTTNLTREDMIEDLMESIAFESDVDCDEALTRFFNMSTTEIRAEYERG